MVSRDYTLCHQVDRVDRWYDLCIPDKVAHVEVYKVPESLTELVCDRPQQVVFFYRDKAPIL